MDLIKGWRGDVSHSELCAGWIRAVPLLTLSTLLTLHTGSTVQYYVSLVGKASLWFRNWGTAQGKPKEPSEV